MVEHTQTIRRQFADELFRCVWPFCGIGDLRVNLNAAQVFNEFESQMLLDPSNVHSTKWSNTLKQFIGKSRQIVWVCLTILWGLLLKS